ncbi:uncharacterized protein LOC129912079 [Episyrphus balteatus]|uniref:uncharacterized protein LOC129912079 n=1 Tax=Episyrphus balteatus TaxID=286459 RepID=UPI002486A564|nr:uncharacterized protein LOC129912079 [Episyrphus balteatus]
MSSRSVQIVNAFCILTTLIVVTDSARILGLFATPSKSHLIIHTAIVDALVERGHDVTVATTIPLIKKNHRFRHVQLDPPVGVEQFMSSEINDPPPFYKKITKIANFLTDYSEQSLNQTKMRKLMDEESYDLVILGYFMSDLMLGVAAHFKCPVVVSFMIQTNSMTNYLVGNPNEVSYVPSIFLGVKQPMGFVNRLKNFLIVNIVEEMVMKNLFNWYQEAVYTANFPPDKYPPFDEVKKNISLILTNHHFSQTPIRPNVPAMVEVGGIQIKEKPDPLPEDIKGILDNSTKHGVIYFSLGSNVKGSYLDTSKVKIIFDVLSKLPHTVLWKWGDAEVPGTSPNIVYKSWLPQDDVLNHKNIKLFVTHGGQGSVVESQYHGVPMVGIPLFGEQSSNMESVVKDGFGLSVDYLTLNEKDFDYAVKEVLTNPKYTDNVRRFAKIYKDRPMTARETAVFWVEYVLRHRGAPHMQSPAVHLNAFQLMSLDVIGFLLAVIYVTYKIIKIVFKFLIGLCRKKKSKVESRILGLFSTTSKSHLIIHTAIVNALVDRGHNVTVATTIPLVTKNHGFRHIQLDTPFGIQNMLASDIKNPPKWYKKIITMSNFLTNYAEKTLNQTKIQQLMDEETFDLIILGYFMNDLLLGLGAHFKCPVVVSFVVRSISATNFLIANPNEASYVPSLFLGVKQPMDFMTRLKNYFVVNFIEGIFMEKLFYWYQEAVYRTYFPPNKYPSFDEVRKNVSLLLTNHHFSQTPIRPNVPAMVEIGGIQIKEKPDPLPEDIKSILDNSTQHGVVYFSLGSNIQGHNLDTSKVKIIFDVLSKLPQTVLWKWGDAEVPGTSPNIVYKSWLPQDDILNHKNVKLFITHGGQGGVVEAQYHGVPMVGIPLFGEQHSNMESVVKDGFGLSVNYQTLTEKDFHNAINEVLTNKKYTDNVRRFSKIYKDRPMTARETAVFWVEYVLRHRGAPHMQSPAVHLNAFQLMSLDVIGFILAVIYIIYKIIKIVFKFMLRLCQKKKNSPPGIEHMIAEDIKNPPPWYKKITEIADFLTNYAVKTINQPKMQKLMDEESFDLVILGYLMNDLVLGLGAHFKCPVVVSFVIQTNSVTNELVGNPNEASYVPSLFLGVKQPMGFVDRFKNFFAMNIAEDLFMGNVFYWYQEAAYKKLFPPDKYPTFDQVRKNVSLVLTNHHFSQTPIRPNVPAMVEIGGIQIKEKPDPLPEDIKAILDNSTKTGVVYFSFGSNVKASSLESSKVKIIFDVLSKLPQTVLWKWGDSELPGTSPNIVYKSWLPQDDVLNHKNVKLFVTHGGLGSVVESQYHGVPMVGIPLFADQSANMESVVKDGFGLLLDYQTLNEEGLDKAVKEVLTNQKYTNNVRRFAKLYKDRPMTARETAVFWVEYVLRHRGAPHMQSPAVHLNAFQLMSLDVIGFLLAVIYIIYKIIKIVFKFMIGLCRKKKTKIE